MLCQNTCEVPLGITAIVVRPASRFPPQPSVASSASPAPAFATFFIHRPPPSLSPSNPHVGLLDLEVPEPPRVPAEHGFPFFGGAAVQVFGDDRHRPPVVGGERADGPVRADHEPAGAEALRRRRRGTAGSAPASTLAGRLR